MKIEEIKNILPVNAHVELASSVISRNDILDKIIKYINSRGVDVDETYLNEVNSLSFQNVKIDIAYIPVYFVSSIASLCWKENLKDTNETIEHNEYVRFNSLFYAHEEDKNDRINKLKIKKIFAKNDFKLDEHEVDEDYIIKDEKYLLANHNDLLPQVILDVENHNEYYPLDTKYSLNQSEIDERIEENLHKTKSYKKLLKQNERFASVVQNQINVVLIPIARIHLGKYEELVNAANGEIDVIYELSKKVTSQLKKGKWIYLPSVIIFVIFAAVSLAILIFAQDLGVQFLFKESKVWLPLRNFSGYLYFILLFFGIIFALIGIPSRKNIVKRITNNKDSLTILKNASFFLYGIDIGLIIFFFLLLPYLF